MLSDLEESSLNSLGMSALKPGQARSLLVSYCSLSPASTTSPSSSSLRSRPRSWYRLMPDCRISAAERKL